MPLEFLGAQEEYVEFVIREVLPEAARLADAAYVFLERGSFEVWRRGGTWSPASATGSHRGCTRIIDTTDWRYLAYHLGGDHVATRIKSGRLL